MPKASPLQPSFAGGEFSPKVYGRVDNERYKTGLAKAENYLPTVQGPMIRRPPMKYVGDAKDPSKPPAFIPFQFSQTQNYVLEFGDKYLRFYTNNTQIIINTQVFTSYTIVSTAFGSSFNTFASREAASLRIDETFGPTFGFFNFQNSGILEIRTPYSHPDVHNIKWAQKEDALFLFNTSYPTFKLIRNGNLFWDLTRVQTQDGPYLPVNSYRQTGDSPYYSIRLGLTSVSSDGATFPIRYNNATSGPRGEIVKAADNGAGLVRIFCSSAHSFDTGSRVVVLGVSAAVGINNGTSSIAAMSWPVTRVTATTFDLEGSAFVNSGVGTGGFVFPALFQPLLNGNGFADTGRTIGLFGANAHRIWGKITDVLDMARIKISISEADGAAIALGQENFFTNSTAFYWQMEPYNFGNGFPSTGCFHQDRLALAGSPGYPQRLDLSMAAGNYQRFAPSNSSLIVTDANAISFTLAAEQVNRIHWLKSDTQGLLAGSFSSEWNVTPNNQAAALTPTNVNAKQTSTFGSHDADAIQTGNATLYIQKGQQRVRELNYFFQVDTYRSTDIAELADHLMAPGLTKLVNQRESIPIGWALTTEGKLRSMTYSRDDASLKVGWAPHRFGGRSDTGNSAPVIKTMAEIPSTDGTYDQLWCAVQRFINGTSVLSIEVMGKIPDESSLQEDAFCLDMSGTYDLPINISHISRAGSAVVTATSHGFVDGDLVQIKKVIGVNSSFVDSMGVIFTSSLVNYQVFRAGSTSASAFFLQDVNNGSSYIDSRAYSAYFSGGEARKLVQTITGLTWLKNETVSVLADGKWHPDVTVNSGGFFALDYRAATVQVGYPYNSDGKTLRPEAGSGDGTSIGKIRRAYRAAFMVHKVGDLSVGPSFEKLTPVHFETFDPPRADRATPLYSGMVRESLESEHDFEGQVCWRQNSPLPGMIQTVTVMLEENDV